MENPFEIINERLDRIEILLKNMYSKMNNQCDGVTIPEIMNVTEASNYLKIRE